MKAFAARAFVFLALCVFAAPHFAVGADAGKPTLIYLSAKDCPTCRGWERSYLPSFEKSAARKKVEWREVSVATVWHINREAEWPADLQWLRKQVPESATPRFYLIRGDHLLVKGDGVSGWTDSILPALAKLPAS